MRVAYRTCTNIPPITNEMVDWLLARGRKLEETIQYHDPLLVECVEELKPSGWRVDDLGNDKKYIIFETLNDCVLITESDLKRFEKDLIDTENE